MKKNIPASLLPACLLLLAGCQQLDPSSGHSAETTVSPAETGKPAETTLPAETMADTVTETEAAAPAFTDTDTTTSSMTLVPLFTTQPLPDDIAQGGEGGEEHGGDPDPTYFNYRFMPDGVTMRLAGGNYQTIPYDFSEMVRRGTADYYYIEDINFNGSPDLFAAAAFQNSDIVYAVFLWNAETLHFETEPLLLTNPVCHADTKTLTTTEQLDENQARITAYRWDNDSLVPTGTYTADYAALTVKAVSDGIEIASYSFIDRDSMTSYFLSLR